MGLLAVLALSITVGCGGSNLNTKQQREYDSLKKEESQIGKKIGSATKRADRAFKKLGALEKKKGLVFKQVVACGGSARNPRFGPFQWGKKHAATLVSKGSKTVSGQACKTYSFKVVK